MPLVTEETMKSDFKLIYHYKYNKKIELRREDVKALLFLYDQSLLSQPQLFIYYRLVIDRFAEASFRRKTKKWHEAGIIRKSKRSIENGYKLAFLNLTEAGLTLLKGLGLIHSKSQLKYRPDKNIDHTLVIKQIALEIFIKAKEEGIMFYLSGEEKIRVPITNIDSFLEKLKGEVHFYKREDLGKNQIHLPFTNRKLENTELIVNNSLGVELKEIKPDLMVYYKKQLVFFEVDTGNESIDSENSSNQNTIVSKVKRYNYLKTEYQKQEVFIATAFVLVDKEQDVITLREHSNKKKRILNMKEIILIKVLNHNFSVYAIGMSRIREVVYLFFTGRITPLGRIFNDKGLRWLAEFLNKNLKNETLTIEVTHLNNYKTYGINTINFNYSPENILTLHHLGGIQHIVPVLIREGHIKEMEKTIYYLEKAHKGFFAFNSKILLVYSSNAALENDVFGKTKPGAEFKSQIKHLLKISLEDINNGIFRLYDFNGLLKTPEDILIN